MECGKFPVRAARPAPMWPTCARPLFRKVLDGLNKLGNSEMVVGGHVRRRGGAMRGVQVHPQPKGHWPEPVLGMELELCRKCLKARPESFAFSGSCGITGFFFLQHGL